jgi:hypothetical protein
VLYATDFSGDELGDFPRAFRLRGGNAEVAEVGGTRYLRMTSFGEFEVPLPETLPSASPWSSTSPAPAAGTSASTSCPRTGRSRPRT